MQKSKFSLLLFLWLLLMSCDGLFKPSKSSPVISNTQSVNDSNLIAKGIDYNQSKDSSLSLIILKMKKLSKLSEYDYKVISEFLLKNKNESLSEEVGYNLYSYLKGSSSRNSEFLSFLSTKDGGFRDQILVALIEIMCIDLGEDNYTYEKVVHDFSIFKNNDSAKKAFKSCMDNQVE